MVKWNVYRKLKDEIPLVERKGEHPIIYSSLLLEYQEGQRGPGQRDVNISMFLKELRSPRVWVLVIPENIFRVTQGSNAEPTTIVLEISFTGL